MKWLLPKRRRIAAAGNVRSDTRWNSAKFDESTGQVYLETTAAIPTYDDKNWARDSRLVKGPIYRDDEDYDQYLKRLGGRTKGLEKYHMRVDEFKNSRVKNFKGARSLQDGAIECILENISDITLEGIECLPIAIVRRIWHAVNARCSKSFSTWIIFSKILRHNAESLELLRYHQEIERPNCHLGVYTDPLTSKSFDFITSLSITTFCPGPDLRKLSSMPNLGVLEIINTTGPGYLAVGDRLIRSWHLAASEDGAWPVLRILRLWNHEDLTEKSLVYLNSFSALAVYDVKGCAFSANARVEVTPVGWKATLAIDILDLLEQACEERASLMRVKLGIQVKTCDKPRSKMLWDGAKVWRIPHADVPVLLAKRPVFAPSGDKDQDCADEFSWKRINAIRPDKKASKTQLQKLKTSHQYIDRSWDLPVYMSFARIGELRNDIDLVRAGVVVNDQALVGNNLINSVPMTSIRLGESPSWLEFSANRCENEALKDSFDWTDKPRLADSSMRGLAFFRIKLLPQDCLPIEGRASRNGINGVLGGSEPQLKQPPLIRREASRIAANKKRKLEDMLSSFL